MSAAVPLSSSLALAERALGTIALAAAEDPLGLDLPPRLTEDLPDGQTMSVIGSLYLFGELEEAGVIVAAELLADERDSFALPSAEAARRLDAFAQRRSEWPDRAARERLYARLFGATDAPGAPVNREFHTRLGTLCHALASYGAAGRYGEHPAAAREIAVALSAQGLLEGLRVRGLGSAVAGARRAAAQTRQALELLDDPGIGVLVGGRGVWDTLARLFGAGAPDCRRLVDRGQSGQHVLGWAGAVFGADAAPRPPIGAEVIRRAAIWLVASGVELEEAV